MRIHDVRTKNNGHTVERHASVHHDTNWVWGDSSFDLWYRYPIEWADFITTGNGDPFLAAFLAPAMLLHEDSVIEAPVSRKLLHRAQTTIQDILSCFDRRAHRIRIRAPIRDRHSNPTGGANGLFFSMGVDSSYSLLKNISHHRDDDRTVTDLITVEGFDVYLWESELFVPMLRKVREVGAATRKRVLPVTTNLRELSDRVADWLRLYHGSALASVALGLGHGLKTVRIAATHTYDRLYPLGSHPLLDLLWSTEDTSFIHDGCEAGRLQKLALIAHSEPDTILQSLRVCIADGNQGYNCGTCEKCLRTMIGLHVHGALARCQSLPHTIDPAQVAALRITSPHLKLVYRDMADALGDTQFDQELKNAILSALLRADIH